MSDAVYVTGGEDVTADLITWLRTQLDDDERVAREAEDSTNLSHGEWPFWIDVDDEFAKDTAQAWRDRFHPAQALAEVRAKRRILDAGASRSEHESPGEYIYFGGWSSCTDDCPGTVWYEIVKLLALPYADRPGYREAWRA